MTTVYFVRHAEPDISVHDDRLRPLAPKGQRDTALVARYLHDKNIEIVLSSSYKRALDTVLPFADAIGIQVETIEDFRERKVDSGWIEDFDAFKKKRWDDFTYKLSDGECHFEVQERNISALKCVLTNHECKSIVIGTHGTALSMIINYYDNAYGYEDFEEMHRIFPWLVQMDFDGNDCMRIMKIDLFQLQPNQIQT